jgi:hypothetical protein
VATVVQFRDSNAVTTIAVRARVVPCDQFTLAQYVAGELLEYAGTVAMVDLDDVETGVVAPLQVNLDLGFGFVCTHTVQVNFNVDRIDSASSAG